MTEPKHYRKAPIIEATISFEVVPPTELSVKDLAAIQEPIQDRYPQVAEEYFYAGEVSVAEPGGPPKHDDVHQHMGYSFHSEDERLTLRAGLDSFDFSVGQPYDRWEPFRDEARRMWELFKSVSGTNKVSRVALRYINRIDIPGTDIARLDHYFKVYPEMPDEWPSGPSVNNFFMQLQTWQTDLECMLIVNQAPARPPSGNIVSVRLDFDLFRERYDDPWSVEDDTNVWEFLERLRERKNEVFEASITDETRRLIE